MLDRLARTTHHSLKTAPGLKWVDAAGLFLWFRGFLPVLRFICGIGLLIKLVPLAVYHRKRLVMLCRFGGLGDIICSLPAVREFIRKNPDVQVVYVTRAGYRPLIDRSGLDIPCVTTPVHPILPVWMAGIVGRSIELRTGEEAKKMERPSQHLIKEFALCLGLAGIPEETVLQPDPAQVEKIRARYLSTGKRQLVLIHTGPSWAVREWPFESWTQLASMLNGHPAVQILQIVSERNVSLKDARCEIVPGAIPIPCSDQVDLLIDTVAAADLLIGIDSGPVHVAGAVGTDCVAIFGPTDPKLRLVKSTLAHAAVHLLDCSFCHHRRPILHWQSGCPHDIACMKNVTVEQVLRKAVDFLPAQDTV